MRKAVFDTQQCAALCENWKNEARVAAEGMKVDPNILMHIGVVRLGFHISGGATVYFTLETELIKNSSEDDLAEALYNEILLVASPRH